VEAIAQINLSGLQKNRMQEKKDQLSYFSKNKQKIKQMCWLSEVIFPISMVELDHRRSAAKTDEIKVRLNIQKVCLYI